MGGGGSAGCSRKEGHLPRTPSANRCGLARVDWIRPGRVCQSVLDRTVGIRWGRSRIRRDHGHLWYGNVARADAVESGSKIINGRVAKQ